MRGSNRVGPYTIHVIKLIANSAVLIAGSLIMLAGSAAVALLFIAAFLIVVFRRISRVLLPIREEG